MGREESIISDRPAPGAALAGAAWMAASTLFFAALAGLTRQLAADYHPFEIAFFRTFFSLLIMLPWLARAGIGALSTPRLGLHAVRALVSAVAMFTWFAAMAYMPLSEAVSLNFTAPIFGTLMAVLILGERAGVRRWMAIGGGFCGALVILRPGFQTISPVALLALAAALTIAVSMLMIKVLTRTDSSNAIITWSAILTTPLTLIGALFVWTTPDLTGLVWLAALGATGTLAHVCMTRALAAAEAVFVLPFDFLRLPLTALLAFVFFGETPDGWVWIGAAIIFAAATSVTLETARRPAAAAEG